MPYVTERQEKQIDRYGRKTMEETKKKKV